MLVASPASAAEKLQIQDINPVTLTVGGGPQPLLVTVKNTGDVSSTATTLTLDVPLSDRQVAVGNVPPDCAKFGSRVTCEVAALKPDGLLNLSIQLTAPATSTLTPGAEVSGTGSAVLKNADTKSFRVNLRGPNQAPVVPEVSGQVVDMSTGTPLANALVLLQDGARREHNVGTDGQGRYRFTSTADKPITPGSLTIGASRNGYENGTATRDARAGQAVTGVLVKLKPVAAAAAPSAPMTEPSLAPEVAATPVEAAPNIRPTSSGMSMLSWVLIVLGGLLVLLGIGAIALLVIRRKDDDGDLVDLDDPRPMLPVAAAMPPAGRAAYRGEPDLTMPVRSGMYDETEVVAGPTVPAAPDGYDEYPGAYRTSYPTSPAGHGPVPTSRAGYGARVGANHDSGVGAAATGYGSYGSGHSGYGWSTADRPDVRGNGDLTAEQRAVHTARHSAPFPPGRSYATNGGRNGYGPYPAGYDAAGGYRGSGPAGYFGGQHDPDYGYDRVSERRERLRPAYDEAPTGGGSPRRSAGWLDD
jgi:hypothetical protein